MPFTGDYVRLYDMEVSCELRLPPRDFFVVSYQHPKVRKTTTLWLLLRFWAIILHTFEVQVALFKCWIYEAYGMKHKPTCFFPGVLEEARG